MTERRICGAVMPPRQGWLGGPNVLVWTDRCLLPPHPDRAWHHGELWVWAKAAYVSAGERKPAATVAEGEE